jgi:hypothetical protein
MCIGEHVAAIKSAGCSESEEVIFCTVSTVPPSPRYAVAMDGVGTLRSDRGLDSLVLLNHSDCTQTHWCASRRRQISQGYIVTRRLRRPNHALTMCHALPAACVRPKSPCGLRSRVEWKLCLPPLRGSLEVPSGASVTRPCVVVHAGWCHGTGTCYKATSVQLKFVCMCISDAIPF